MLIKFEVTNFKNFNETLVFDLTKTNAYEFNKECVTNGVVNKSLVYGHNGVGKSNLGFAIFDLISHLTDKSSGSEHYNNYLNASNTSEVASFLYEFKFGDDHVIYKYGKSNFETLTNESLHINNVEYAHIDRKNNSIASIHAAGAENLKRDIGASQISLITYIKKNSVLEENRTNRAFFKFIEFVNEMLFFRSLEKNNYIGLQQGTRHIGADIIEQGNIEDFEEFLNDAGIECKLKPIEGSENPDIAFDFGGKLIPFYDIASQGTKSLSLFYYWLQRLKKTSVVSFLFIDEFDAFYHHSLSANIVRILREIDAQVIITTHNTSIMTNDLLRPDCYFLMNKKGLHSLSNSTAKDLREAHNIEKMYKAGAFN